MNGIIDKLTVLMGVGRDGRDPEPRHNKKGRRRENDTVTISDEARRLFVSEFESEATVSQSAPHCGSACGESGQLK
jgi:hypothetical protein